MKKDKKLQSNASNSNRNSNATNKNNNQVTNCNAKASNSKNIGFENDDKSFELETDSRKSFELE